MIREANEIEALKRSWHRDPHWDIEDTEGFKEHRDELKAYSETCKAEWKQHEKEAHTKLENMVCPILSIGVEGFGHCRVEQCAWWNEAQDCCAIKAEGRS